MAKGKTKVEALKAARAGMASQVADYLAEVDPEAFGMLVGRMLMKLVELDRDAYNVLGALIVRNTLLEGGFPEAVAELKQRLAAGDAQAAAEVAERIGIWAAGIESLASGGAVQKLIDAQEAAGSKSKSFVM